MMAAGKHFETDALPTTVGDVVVTFLGHGSLILAWQGKQIYLDPYGKVADYSLLPKADLVLITHEHQDHCDLQSLAHVRTPETKIVLTPACAQKVEGGIVMRNGDERTVEGIPIAAVPAYNLLHKRENGQPFHPQGAGNGYILTLGDMRIYFAGDTENIPEMKQLQGIDCAFLPMNLPYTMTPEMVADAVRAFRPRILYPYHYGSTDTARLVELLHGENIEVRIRQMA
jgi:L-ascorbate metabolism protein UlaG (beta-lactamase superfamily)